MYKTMRIWHKNCFVFVVTFKEPGSLDAEDKAAKTMGQPQSSRNEPYGS
jgi:hypothetical protein